MCNVPLFFLCVTKLNARDITVWDIITRDIIKRDIIVCSLNVRGLSKNQKRRETFLWLKTKKFSTYFLKKKCIAEEKQKSVGNPNSGTQLFLQIFFL